MSLASDNINLVDDFIDLQVNSFLTNIEKRERGIFNRVLSIAKGLDTDAQGNMLRTTKNLRLLGKIRQEIQDNILTDAYIKDVEKFSGQFEAVQKLNNGYFEAIEQSFNPNRQLYRQILKDSVTATKNSLLGAGIEEQVIQPVMEIVSDSVTSGASYGDMVLTLEQKMMGDAENLGTLRRYSQQITKDALNQFNGAYNEAVANTHKLDWFLYLGGRTSKTRPFCKKYHNQYFHRREVEDFGKGKDLDGSNLCSGSFCAGRIKGTTASNIFKNRGGYNCNHVYKPTQIELVPKKVVERNIEKGYVEAEKFEDKLKEKNVPKNEVADNEKTSRDQIKHWYKQPCKGCRFEETNGTKYSEAINSYTGSGYSTINRHLRGEIKISKDNWRHKDIERIPILNEAIKNAPKATGTLYRGTEIPSNELFEQLKKKYIDNKHDIYYDAGFLSTTWDEKVAETFMGYQRTRMHIKGKNGAYLGAVGNAPSEREVIFPSETYFRVIKAELRGKQQNEIFLELEEM